MLAIDELRSHVIVAVASDCVLSSCTAHRPNHGTLSGLARFLQPLRSLLCVSKRLDCVTAADLCNLRGGQLFLG